jgi:hypothetical protein
VPPQLGIGLQHNYSTKTQQVGFANEQFIYSELSMDKLKTISHNIFWMTMGADL